MPLLPQWGETFKYSTHQRLRQCVICNRFTNQNTLKAINATRASLLYLEKDILLHPHKDKLCSIGDDNCNAKTEKELLETPDNILLENIETSSIAEDRTKRIVQNMAALLKSKFFYVLLKQKFSPKKENIFIGK
eukprot:182253_1